MTICEALRIEELRILEVLGIVMEREDRYLQDITLSGGEQLLTIFIEQINILTALTIGGNRWWPFTQCFEYHHVQILHLGQLVIGQGSTFQLFVYGKDLLIQPVLHRGIQAEFMGEEAQGRRDNLKAGKEE